MKTIEITSGNQKAQFTTKSLTFNGREFFYANMTDVVNHTDIHTYTFVYDGVSKALPYEEKDEAILNKIFSQVQGMQAGKQKPASGQNQTPQTGGTMPKNDSDASGSIAPSEKAAKKEPQEVPAQENLATQDQAAKAEDTKTAEKPEQPKDAAEKKDAASPLQTPESTDKKSDEKPSLKETFSAAKKNKKEKRESSSEGIDVDPHRQEKLKKSFTVFGIIIAIFIVLSLIFYFVFGTSSNPDPSSPRVTESQQYEDIDDVIKGMQ